MEFADYGDLNSFLIHQEKQIDWILRMKWSIQLTNTLLYLHQKGIIHRKF
jgi:serine/threonine protein kinase